PQVLFTGVVASPGMEVALKTLGGSMATSVFDCTHLVTDRVRRTVKFLCAVARGVPVVTPEWLHEVPRGWGTGEGGLGDKDRVLGDRKGDLGGLWGRENPWGQGWGLWGQGSSLGTGVLGDMGWDLWGQESLGDVEGAGDRGQCPWGQGFLGDMGWDLRGRG
ncbi:UNVERIFIED_CONTAM: Mediator of DNA damage checkpoint protein 1, partial [Eudyptes pachyrhynchus]